MDVTEVLARLGGVADAGSLTAATSRKRVRTALRAGRILRIGHGTYALPTASEARRAAERLRGVMSGLSAAAYWGWEVKQQPVLPVVTVPAKRNLPATRRHGVAVTWRDLPAHQVYQDIVTRPGPTVIECARTLPFDEALAVADSALRHGDVDRDDLVTLALALPRGRRRVLRVVEAADPLEANPFESVVRAIALGVTGLDVAPQVEIAEDDFFARPDLVDERRRVVIECDSFEFHGHRAALRSDCRRYTALTIRGWRVLRFSWEDAMHDPGYVRRVLTAVVSGAGGVRRSVRAVIGSPGA